MPTLYLTTPGTRAHLTSQHLEVELPADRSGATDGKADISRPLHRRIPLHDIEQVVVESVSVRRTF